MASRRYLVTGGAGFIGANYVDHLLGRGEEVVVFDNLCRLGARDNVAWLRSRHGDRALSLVVADVRDREAVDDAVGDADVIVHLAGQVAVTGSIQDPREDFEVNALGTLNLLEAARLSSRSPLVVYASTNKVYGAMEDLELTESDGRYHCAPLPHGVPETRPLDFHSPYGCSKGAGDQYVRDYHRIYGLPTVVLRQSCVYGPRQFGVEDQGWVAWLVIAAMTGQEITIYGNGKQVRDLLWVDDLVACYDSVVERAAEVAGEIFNVGGGPGNTLSVWHEFAPLLGRLLGCEMRARFRPTRPGDQRVYVSDIRRAATLLGWRPTVSPAEGIGLLVDWVQANRELFAR